MSFIKDFKNALTSLEKTDVKRSTAENTKLVKIIQSHANSCGLSQEFILRVIKLGASGRFSMALSNILIQCLVPKESVPEDAVICAISKITSGKCPLRVQATIFKWIITVFDLISPKCYMYSLYGMIFNLLDYEILCQYVCHLLYLMTRQEDVTHFRISRLMLQQKRVGSQPYITALMSVYRLYQPSLVTLSHNKKGRFKKIDETWKSNILKISAPSFSELKHNSFGEKRQTGKECIIPAVTPVIANNPSSQLERPFETISGDRSRQAGDIKSIDDLISSIGRTTLPSRAASLLSTRCLKHILAISPDSSLKVRLRLWIHERFYSRFYEDDDDNEKQEETELLKLALDQRELFQMSTILQQPLLYNYLETWSCRSNADIVLKLISKLPLLPISTLHKNVLSVLDNHFMLAPDTGLRCKILDALTELTCNYIAVEIPNSEMEEVENDVNVTKVIEHLATFADRLIVLGTFLTESSTKFLYSGLQFWLCVTLTLKNSKLKAVILPHFSIVYKGLFTCNSVLLNCISETITNLISIYSTNLKDDKFVRHSKVLEKLNTFIADIHDSLWRHSAFHPACSEKSIAFKDLSVDFLKRECGLMDDTFATSSFSIDKHPALIVCTALYANKHKLVTEQALTSELLLTPNYIKYLKKEGFYSILKLLKQLTELTRI